MKWGKGNSFQGLKTKAREKKKVGKFAQCSNTNKYWFSHECLMQCGIAEGKTRIGRSPASKKRIHIIWHFVYRQEIMTNLNPIQDGALVCHEREDGDYSYTFIKVAERKGKTVKNCSKPSLIINKKFHFWTVLAYSKDKKLKKPFFSHLCFSIV